MRPPQEGVRAKVFGWPYAAKRKPTTTSGWSHPVIATQLSLCVCEESGDRSAWDVLALRAASHGLLTESNCNLPHGPRKDPTAERELAYRKFTNKWCLHQTVRF